MSRITHLSLISHQSFFPLLISITAHCCPVLDKFVPPHPSRSVAKAPLASKNKNKKTRLIVKKQARHGENVIQITESLPSESDDGWTGPRYLLVSSHMTSPPNPGIGKCVDDALLREYPGNIISCLKHRGKISAVIKVKGRRGFSPFSRG
ncbi:hypothetical protein L873DRAFT_324946 [Choiromyces venosus 120613-1]|uniref:Uncharacterized protein n=1 Tax=Choiromyces venosus 120613-1 TaxID=1336337 RepID=A0A3N4K398_9PEZI|nr:hypothetical protein L873DRAFT_324946 [Choiromyces venosus 120613-1]